MRIRGVGTAKLVAKWLRTRFGRPGPLIIGYHRILEVDRDPQQLCVSPRHFEEQLDALKQSGRPLSLHDFVSALHDGRDLRGAFVITFDDGYEDTIDTAIPILEKLNIPASIFVPTAMIGKNFWWCEIESIVDTAQHIPPVIALDLGGEEFRWEAPAEANDVRALLIYALCAHFRSLPFVRTDESLQTLRTIFELPSNAADIARAMSAEQIEGLSRHPLVEVGSHTVTHRSLKDLTLEEQQDEIRQSKEALESLCGQRIESFAYPNGSISRRAPDLLEKLGFRCGITSLIKPVSRRTSPYLLPRPFVGDWDGDEFSRWIARWLA